MRRALYLVAALIAGALITSALRVNAGYVAISVSGYLIEKSLSVDNVFVWAVLFTYFAVPREYQFRVLFWGIFGALAMRASSRTVTPKRSSSRRSTV